MAWTLKRQDWTTEEWSVVAEYTGREAEGNATYAARVERIAGNRFRLYQGERLVIDHDPYETED